jgi:hypothetical protein
MKISNAGAEKKIDNRLMDLLLEKPKVSSPKQHKEILIQWRKIERI